MSATQHGGQFVSCINVSGGSGRLGFASIDIRSQPNRRIPIAANVSAYSPIVNEPQYSGNYQPSNEKSDGDEQAGGLLDWCMFVTLIWNLTLDGIVQSNVYSAHPNKIFLVASVLNWIVAFLVAWCIVVFWGSTDLFSPRFSCLRYLPIISPAVLLAPPFRNPNYQSKADYSCIYRSAALYLFMFVTYFQYVINTSFLFESRSFWTDISGIHLIRFGGFSMPTWSLIQLIHATLSLCFGWIWNWEAIVERWDEEKNYSLHEKAMFFFHFFNVYGWRFLIVFIDSFPIFYEYTYAQTISFGIYVTCCLLIQVGNLIFLLDVCLEMCKVEDTPKVSVSTLSIKSCFSFIGTMFHEKVKNDVPFWRHRFLFLCPVVYVCACAVLAFSVGFSNLSLYTRFCVVCISFMSIVAVPCGLAGLRNSHNSKC